MANQAPDFGRALSSKDLKAPARGSYFLGVVDKDTRNGGYVFHHVHMEFKDANVSDFEYARSLAMNMNDGMERVVALVVGHVTAKVTSEWK